MLRFVIVVLAFGLLATSFEVVCGDDIQIQGIPQAPRRVPNRVLRSGDIGFVDINDESRLGERSGVAELTDLPSDARILISQFETQTAQIQRQTLSAIEQHRTVLMSQLQELQDRYTRDGKLDEAISIRDRLRAMRPLYTPREPVIPNLYQLRGQINRVVTLRVTGQKSGSVWGTDVYTDDSDVATAAVHAGVLKLGETADINVTILDGKASYTASTRNGVASFSYESFGGSYRVERAHPVLSVAPAVSAPTSITTVAPRPIVRSPFVGVAHGQTIYGRGEVGDILKLNVTGSTDGFVWGTRIYTDDSVVGTAAVHAGLLDVGQTGVVELVVVPGQPSYDSSTANQVITRPYSSWHRSFVFLSGPKVPRTTEPSPARTSSVLRNINTVMQFRQDGPRILLVQVTGSTTTGAVFGTEIYSDDTSISAAAVHAGLLKDGETGILEVTLLPGQDSYLGSERNGVTSLNWHQWGGSFRLSRGAR